MSQQAIQEYVNFVESTITKFKDMGDVVRSGEVVPDKVYKAMSNWYDTVMMLMSEYNRIKIEQKLTEIEYDEWYSQVFQSARDSLYTEAKSASYKPSLKEIEQKLQQDNAEKSREWRIKMVDLEVKSDFYIRMREILYKYDNILSNMAAGLRSELRALSIEERAAARVR